MSFDLAKHKRQIQAFYPAYLQSTGNVTQVDTISGESYVVQTSLRTFLNRFCSCFAVDRSALQQRYGQLTGQKNIIPLPLGLSYIFIPLQIRQPLLPGDGATGYVQLHRIKDITDEGENGCKSTIHLADGRQLSCFNTAETVRKHVQAARYIYEIYLQDFCGSLQYREMLSVLGLLRRMIK